MAASDNFPRHSFKSSFKFLYASIRVQVLCMTMLLMMQNKYANMYPVTYQLNPYGCTIKNNLKSLNTYYLFH